MAGIAVEPDPDHHLWRNGRLWWVAFTVHLPGWQKERVRLSLRTHDLAEARLRRDAVLRHYPETWECELSLRLAAPRKPNGSPAQSPRRAFAPRARRARHVAPGGTRAPTSEGAAVEAGLG
jgi:hypothetical protein